MVILRGVGSKGRRPAGGAINRGSGSLTPWAPCETLERGVRVHMHHLLIGFALLAAGPKAAEEPRVQDRRDAYYHFSLGIQKRMEGDAEAALAELRLAQKLDPKAAAIHAAAARLLRELGKGAEAVAEAQAAVRVDPKSVDAHLTLAQI